MIFLKRPKDTQNIHWTRHSKNKMRQYQLSEKRVLRVLRNPERKEEGVAQKTIAVMQPYGTKKHPKEIWVMYQIKDKKLKIISAWRYPGKSPIGKIPEIPEDTLKELENLIK
ncbi:hypothetical protein AMJ49_02845 [Parcubacteria bacterium DG_74_2]|nr:MAG: hypothetical protein AMJ49_02845 [Parcubacteria bacterium DG_74_2]